MQEPSPDREISDTVSSPDITQGAMTLLAIAQENDTQEKLATNAALRISLGLAAELPKLCRGNDRAGLLQELGEKELPSTFFSFCAALVNHIDLRVRQLRDEGGSKWSAVTDFDHAVMLALGQSLASVVRAAGEKTSIVGPSIDVVIQRLAGVEARQLQQLIIENYLGNILQEYFDTCKVRLNVRGLPDNTEERLRKEDAHIIAKSLFESLPTANRRIDIIDLQKRLQNTLSYIRKKEETSQ